MKTWQIAYLINSIGKKEYYTAKGTCLSEAMAQFFKDKEIDKEEFPMMNFYIKYLGESNE